jgi:ubiquinone/menaquinone biosynthesis C-methylase UbiE
MILVAYTTRYREGGVHLAQAASTLAVDRRATGHEVRCVAVETKRAFVDALLSAGPLHELHVIAHSGLYGPMFGTTSMPEQLSPHEWRSLPIAFAPGGEAYFHSCRSGRWFAPFFARTFGVPASGHPTYTTVSRRPDRYRRVSARLPRSVPIYVVGQPGWKSNGLLGALGKHAGLTPPVPMVRYPASEPLTEPAYERVAAAYDLTFEDIRVRGPEWRWIVSRVPEGASVLDLGCGTGGLLRALSDRIGHGVGADVSGAMLAHARCRGPGLEWTQLDGPRLPWSDATFDVVVSLLSWRYVDWDPTLAEVARVLRPGGRLLVVDMVACPASLADVPTALAHAVRERAHRRRFPEYAARRERMVRDPDWATMLKYNPMRAEHEYRWFFASRFPEGRMQTLDVARSTRVLAFDTGPVSRTWFPPQSYP